MVWLPVRSVLATSDSKLDSPSVFKFAPGLMQAMKIYIAASSSVILYATFTLSSWLPKLNCVPSVSILFSPSSPLSPVLDFIMNI